MDHIEMSRKGGQSKSERKKLAGAENLKKAREAKKMKNQSPTQDV